MKIYTKTGDDGTTGMIGGSRVRKDDARIEVVGSLDALNVAIGSARAAMPDSPLDFLLERIQNTVFEIGAEVASPAEHARSHEAHLGNIVEAMEKSIDAQTKLLPELRNFLLPGGSEFSCRLHLARCRAREAERRLVTLSGCAPVRPELLVFVNRLSDWLFVAARSANHDAGIVEPVWHKEESEA